MEKLCVKGCVAKYCSTDLTKCCELSAFNLSGMCGAKCTDCEGTIYATDDKYECSKCGKSVGEFAIIELKTKLGTKSWYGGKNNLKKVVFEKHPTSNIKHSRTKFVNAVKELTLSEIYTAMEDTSLSLCTECKAGLTKYSQIGNVAIYQCNNSNCLTRYAKNEANPDSKLEKIVLNGYGKYTKI